MQVEEIGKLGCLAHYANVLKCFRQKRVFTVTLLPANEYSVLRFSPVRASLSTPAKGCSGRERPFCYFAWISTALTSWF